MRDRGGSPDLLAWGQALCENPCRVDGSLRGRVRYTGEQHIGCVIEVTSQHLIAAFRDTARPVKSRRMRIGGSSVPHRLRRFVWLRLFMPCQCSSSPIIRPSSWDRRRSATQSRPVGDGGVKRHHGGPVRNRIGQRGLGDCEALRKRRRTLKARGASTVEAFT